MFRPHLCMLVAALACASACKREADDNGDGKGDASEAVTLPTVGKAVPPVGDYPTIVVTPASLSFDAKPLDGAVESGNIPALKSALTAAAPTTVTLRIDQAVPYSTLAAVVRTATGVVNRLELAVSTEAGKPGVIDLYTKPASGSVLFIAVTSKGYFVRMESDRLPEADERPTIPRAGDGLDLGKLRERLDEFQAVFDKRSMEVQRIVWAEPSVSVGEIVATVEIVGGPTYEQLRLDTR